jgi:predicted nucleic acid-binding protein
LRCAITKLSDSIRSEQLEVLRTFVAQQPNIENMIGAMFQLRLVLDSNAVISDLLWMAKRKKEGNQSAILEVIKAGTLIAYAPEQLRDEVEEHLPSIAKKRKISFDKIQLEWELYQEHLVFIEIDESQLVAYEDSVDPKDAPFVVLSKMLNVPGIISKDPHIEQLGGKRISLDIGVSLRDYSRSAAIVYTIRIGGIIFSTVPIGVIFGIFQAINGILKGLSKLSNNNKLILLAIVILIFVILKSRKYIFDNISNFKDMFGDIWIELEPLFIQLILEEQENNEEAKINLGKIQSNFL